MQSEAANSALSHHFCIEAKWIIPVDPTSPNKILTDSALIIENQYIKDILPTQEAKKNYPNLPRKILANHAIMPGFVNTHCHSPMNILKGYADDYPLMTWLNKHIWPIENKFFSPEFAYDGCMLAIAEMLKSGITCFNDMYFYSDSIAQAVNNVGMRANIGTHVFDLAGPWAQNIDEYINHCLGVEQFKNNLITPVICPHAPYTVSDDSFKKIITFAQKYNMQIGCHLHETYDEITDSLKQYNMRPFERLNSLGLFDQDVYAIHMTHLNTSEIKILEKKQIPVAHCPKSNLKLASGFCPIKDLLDNNITIGIGTDSAASNNDLDMFTEMRTSSLVTKTLASDPTILPDYQAIMLATINGAKLMNLDKKIGSLTIGKQADIIAIDLSDYGSQPVYNPISSIVYTATRQQVSDVWVNGIHKVSDHKLLAIKSSVIQNIVHKWQEKITKFKHELH